MQARKNAEGPPSAIRRNLDSAALALGECTQNPWHANHPWGHVRFFLLQASVRRNHEIGN